MCCFCYRRRSWLWWRNRDWHSYAVCGLCWKRLCDYWHRELSEATRGLWPLPKAQVSCAH